MPVPTPRKGETQQQFVSRCISELSHLDPERPAKQIQAICFSQWREKESVDFCVCGCGRPVESFVGVCAECFDGPLFPEAIVEGINESAKCEVCRRNPAVYHVGLCNLCKESIMKKTKEKKKGRHEDFQVIYDRFVMFFGEEEGTKMYNDFLKQNGLDDTKPYDLSQVLDEALKESFEWTEPLIKYWRHDKEAKYYRMRMITANVSMNLNDYSDEDSLRFAGSNMAWRPVNIDHDHRLRLPFPDNRIETGQVSEEGNSIEAVLRIANKSKKIQDMIESGEIVHPSIEAHPICGLRKEGGRNVPSCGYYIDEVALLRKKYKLPGDPLTQIYPLPINEALASSMVESLQTHNNGDSQEVERNKTPRGEKMSDKQKEKIDNKEDTEAVWHPNADWPDSCFAYVPAEAKGADGKKSLRKFPYKWPDGRVDIPHVRNALARLAGSDIPAADKTRIRNLMQGILKRESPDYEPTEEIEELEEMAKLRSENADLKAEKLTWTKTIESKDEMSREKDGKIKELTKTISKTERELGKALKMKAKLEEAREQLAKTEGKLAELEGENDELKAQNTRKDELIKEDKKANEKLLEEIGKTKIQLSDIRKQRDEATEKAAVATEKAINETRERARIQEENAELREEASEVTQKLSELTDKRVEDSKRIYKLQKENKTFKERDETLNKELKKIRHLNRVQAKVLESLGYRRKQ